MQTGKTTFLSIAAPLCVALVYVVLFFKPWSHPVAHSSTGMTADEAGSLWKDTKSLFEEGKYQDALPGVLLLHERFPGNHIYLEMAANIYRHLGRLPEEAQFWEMYLDRAPDPHAACPRLGEIYDKQDKEKEEISAFERCLARDPDNPDYIYHLAHAQEMAGDMNRAGELYQRGIKISPINSDLVMGLARVRLRQGKPEEAKGPVLEHLEKFPNDVDGLLLAALIYSREGNLPKAKEYLERGVKLSDGYADLHFALENIAERERNYPEAIRQYDRILQDHPDDQSTRAKRDALARKH
jgi:tetratricopeptide (TPR) repeat protein